MHQSKKAIVEIIQTLSFGDYCLFVSLSPTGCATAKVEQHTRDQRLLTALIGFRPADPIRGSRNSVLSEKQVQLGRMFLHMAHVVQQEFEKAHRLSSDPGESDLLVRFLV